MNVFFMKKEFTKKGFTLLELLIVIAIIAILSAVAIFVLNPAETLRETRDAQRISDLATLKTALALYITKATSTIVLDGGTNSLCQDGTGADTIFYSVPYGTDGTQITTVIDGGTFTTSTQVLTASSSLVDGTGWIKVNLSSLTGGSPISNMPVDPTNTVTAIATSSDLVYRYACKTDSTFEIDAQFESSSFATKKAKDGGNNPNYYEVGTKLNILGATSTSF